MTGAGLLFDAAKRLDAAGVPGAMGDARRLLSDAMGIAPGRLTLYLQDDVDDPVADRFDAMVVQRAARVPVSHLLGYRAFYGRDFIVGPDVLDPRPETETLIAAALGVAWGRVLDLGTGSGCILLTLLSERGDTTGIGTDLSDAALAVATRNAAALDVVGRATLMQADWWDGVDGRFDLIVSNPPYIAAAEMPDLAPELKHEPQMALSDGADGLTAYRVLSAGAAVHLAPGGWLMMEIGHRQAADVAALVQAAGLDRIEVMPDLDGRDRVVIGCNSG